MRSRSGSSIWLERRPVTAEVASSSLVRIAILKKNMTSQITLILFNLMIVGVIFTHLFLTTPVVFKSLDEASAANFLRSIFPRYYLLIITLSLPVLLILFLDESFGMLKWLAANVSFHAVLGFLLIPLTNAAKDRGWDKVFSFAHGMSVYCTIVILALSLIQFFLYIG